MLSPDHHVDLEDGRFSRTSRADLTQLFKKAAASGKGLVIHFHGGLVSRNAALEASADLSKAYSKAAYPAFVVWNSDLLSTLRGNLDEIASEGVFRRMVQRVVQFAIGKVLETATARGGRLELRSLKIDAPEDAEQLAASAARFAPREPLTDLTPEQEQQILEELKKDAKLQREAANIAADALPETEVRRALASRGIAEAPQPTRTLMSRSIVREIADERGPEGERALFSSVVLARYGLKILRRVLSRYFGKRHHGLYTTVVEETLRVLYVDQVGALMWSMMKKDTADAFAGSADTYGGTALLEDLAKWPKDRKVTLVGHSTGAIYIGHLLEAADAKLAQDVQFDLVFLAPAATFRFMRDRLDVLRRRVRSLRIFNLSDELESGYWEIPVLYNRSLLYLISGLLEPDEIDMPLIGMQRYFSRMPPFNSSDVNEVLDWFRDELVWSVTDVDDGKRTNANKHGAFDNDPQTLASLGHILESRS